MTRTSKQGKMRAQSPRKYKSVFPKTGPKRDLLEFGYRIHKNTAPKEVASNRFIPNMSDL